MSVNKDLHQQIQKLLNIAIKHVNETYPYYSDDIKAALIKAYMKSFSMAAGKYLTW